MPSNITLKIISLTLFVLSVSFAHASTENWPLRGKGEVRYLKFIKVYDASIYSPAKLDPKTILKSNVSKCLKLDYAVDLSVDKFRLATDKILRRQHSPEYLNKIKKPLEQLQNAYKPVKPGDYYKLCYQAKTKTLSLEHNKQKLVDIRSVDLASAYLGIWLSNNKPISRPLYNRFFKQVASVN